MQNKCGQMVKVFLHIKTTASRLSTKGNLKINSHHVNVAQCNSSFIDQQTSKYHHKAM